MKDSSRFSLVGCQLLDQARSCKMNYPERNGKSNDSEFGAPGPAETTLRLIARLPAPEGLEDRVHAGLLAAPRGGRVLAWPVSLNSASGWMRSAAAAAIACVVAGGGWGIYSHVQPGQSPRGIAGPRIAGPGQFSTGQAVRRPQTLNGPMVTHPETPRPPQARVQAKALAKPAARAMRNTQTTTVSKNAAPPATPPVQ
jgi:hypothetical protein